MPKRWLRPRRQLSPPRCAVGCHDCGAETSFTGETSNVQAWVWYYEHICSEEPNDHLAYLTLPRLDMTQDELVTWAKGNASISAMWLLKHLGEDDEGQGRHPNPMPCGDEVNEA